MEDDNEEEEDEESEEDRTKPQIRMFGKNKNQVTRNIFKQKKFHSVHGQKKSKSWIMGKKERARKQGKEVKNDSKYSGRKRRSGAF